jgi:hypothetical protein
LVGPYGFLKWKVARGIIDWSAGQRTTQYSLSQQRIDFLLILCGQWNYDFISARSDSNQQQDAENCTRQIHQGSPSISAKLLTDVVQYDKLCAL